MRRYFFLFFYHYRFTLRPSVRPSVRPTVGLPVRLSVCQYVRLKSGSFDNFKTIKGRCMKLGTRIGSNVYNMNAHYLGRYHNMTLKQNCVRPITSLFKVSNLKSDFTTVSQK